MSDFKTLSIRLKAMVLTTVLAFGASGTALAFDESSTAQVNVNSDNVILHGYDAVAYHEAAKPTKGSAQFSARYNGATYWFATAANRNAFEADPARYAPAYGGFCAMGTAMGKKLDVDPSQFKVVDGTLYLNVNADVFKKWSQDIPGNIEKAERNWPVIRDKAPNTL